MNFTNYYTFHITRHITRKPNNRLASQPTFLIIYTQYAHTRVCISLEKGRLVGEVGGMGRIRPIGQMGQRGEVIHLTST